MEASTKSEDDCDLANETGKSKEIDERKVQVTRKKNEINFQEFLRKKRLSQEFVKTVLRVGLTDELVRFLKTLGFIDDDIEELRSLWEKETRFSKETDTSETVSSSTEVDLSLDGVYLKNALSRPLSAALREIVTKKPFDPVEYLGHWLLHYKISEERAKQKAEFDLELTMERERIRMSENAEEEELSREERGDGEELAEDWNYFNYETL